MLEAEFKVIHRFWIVRLCRLLWRIDPPVKSTRAVTRRIGGVGHQAITELIAQARTRRKFTPRFICVRGHVARLFGALFIFRIATAKVQS